MFLSFCAIIAGMFVYSAGINLSLRAYGITVPMLDERVEKVREWIENAVGDGTLPADALMESDFSPVDEDTLRLAHDPGFIDRCAQTPERELEKTFELVDEEGNYRRYEPETAQRPLSELMETARKQVAASVFAAETALEKGFAFLLGGGLHHAIKDAGRGFCQFNDIVVAARSLQKRKLVSTVWVVDIDAHKGDGTASLCAGDDSIATLSVHMARGWPLEGKQRDEQGNLYPWFMASDVDVPVESGEEDLYLAKLEKGLEEMERKFDKPGLAIIVDGSDPYEEDALPSSSLLRLSLDQTLARDLLVFNFFRQKGVPVLYLMSGGYGPLAHRPYICFLEKVVKSL